ncbi:hypothetical protein [Colwellia echini]|uniref:Uncharacterized protein n=1 Tax=Colwellia echini TaxID=1982103 RepID=A0ABY3N2C9_9GAMM|nr:hypothetical protein [Colwellia echini]TYK67372.1 hypothetical protein CWS31_002280 [Colwellia echini]
MKNSPFSAKFAVLNNLKRYSLLVFLVTLTSLLSACQLTPPEKIEVIEKKPEVINYSQYYLWLKSLTNAQVLAEESTQKENLKEHPTEKVTLQGKLVLIYCLPKTPLHHPYKAKRLLNELLLVSNTMTKDNLAFTMLLRDQLNTQLHLLQKQEQLEKEFTRVTEKNKATIELQKEQLNLVNQQLMLLKQIDQNINKRG